MKSCRPRPANNRQSSPAARIRISLDVCCSLYLECDSGRKVRGSGEEAGVQALRRSPGQKKEGPKNQGIARSHFLRDESFPFSIFSSPHALLLRSSAEGP